MTAEKYGQGTECVILQTWTLFSQCLKTCVCLRADGQTVLRLWSLCPDLLCQGNPLGGLSDTHPGGFYYLVAHGD